MKQIALLTAIAALTMGAASPWLGVTAKLPTELDVTHTLTDTLPATYVRIGLDYGMWTNGSYGTNWFDDTYNLNRTNHFLMAVVTSLPTNLVPTMVPFWVARYPDIKIWEPNNEIIDISSNESNLPPLLRLWRAVGVTNCLAGPAWMNPQNPGLFNVLSNGGFFTNLDVITMHDPMHLPQEDFASLPVNWTNGSYYHPDQAPAGGFSNMVDRITILQGYTNLLRTNFPAYPKVILSEYYLFVSNNADAVRVADIITTMQVPVILNTPAYGGGNTNSFPYFHGFWSDQYHTNAVWGSSMQSFLGRLQPTIRVGTMRMK